MVDNFDKNRIKNPCITFSFVKPRQQISLNGTEQKIFIDAIQKSRGATYCTFLVIKKKNLTHSNQINCFYNQLPKHFLNKV